MPLVLRCLMLLLLLSLLLSLRLCDYFLFNLVSSFTSFFYCCLSMWWLGTYSVHFYLPFCHPLRSYVVLSLFQLFSPDHWYHTYLFVVVSHKLLSVFVPLRCCSFFLCLMPSTCIVGSFFRPCGTVLN